MFKIFKAIGKFFSNLLGRGSRRINDAADDIYTNSPSGIADAFDDQRDEMVERAKAFAASMTGLERSRQEGLAELEELDVRERKLIKQRDGALVAAEKAQAGGDDKEFTSAQAAFQRYQREIAEIDARQAILEQEMTQDNKAYEEIERDVKKLEADIQRMGANKARAVSDFIKYKAKIELRQQMAGLQSSYDTSGTDAVRNKLKNLRAEAAVQDRLAGTDVSREDDKYAEMGEAGSADDAFSRMLAARKAEKATATGGEAPETTAKETEGRPNI